MTCLHSAKHRALHEEFGTEKLADLLDTKWVRAAKYRVQVARGAG